MSSTTLFRVSGISLLLGALVSVIAGLMTLFFNHNYTASLGTFQSPLWSTYYSLFFVALVLVSMGLPAFYLRQAGGRGGRLGLSGVLLIALGSFLLMAMIGYFVSILPLLAAKAPRSSTRRLNRAFPVRNRGHTGEGVSAVYWGPADGFGRF
jgi:succinate dehydrogenase hydrophobic anchor subunit